MLLQRRGLLLCCGCGGSAVAAGGRAAALPLDGGDNTTSTDDEGQPGSKSAGPRQVSWAQVEAMTGGFSWGVVGEGGFSTVYLGRVGGGSQLAAVKVHRGGGGSERLQRAFRQELDALLRVRHPHVVRLLAFCCGEHQGGVLVLELAPNGNLHDHLHQKQVTMPWARRVSVALQVACALEYLHDELQVVHGDVKASNVLLDAAMAARLCDFGSAASSACGGFGLSVSASNKQKRARAVLGSPGYVDPHYLRSGLLTSKSDVYSFGVLLLELLTGVQPFRDGRPLLTAALAPTTINNHRPCCDLVDQRLGCRYHAAQAEAMLALAAACVGDNPTLRPSMAHVVRTLERTAQCQASSISISTAGTRSGGGGKL